MTETKKLTKRDYFNALKEIVADKQELIDFIDHELELLDRKASKSTQTKTQIENENIKEVIVKVLEDIATKATVTELQKDERLSMYSNQKISALLKQLVDNEIVKKEIDKRVTRFYV